MEVTRGPIKREGTGTWSFSVLSRALEQKLQLFSARLPRKLPGPSSLSQGSARQPGRFVYLQALENSVTSFWLLFQGQPHFWAREDISFRPFLAAATQDISTSTIPSLQESQPLPQSQLPLSGELLLGGVEQTDRQHLVLDRNSSPGFFCFVFVPW